MASLVRNGKNYGLVWTDNERSPRQVRESLKTDNRKKAIGKKKQLEWQYLNGEHNPWKQKWYERVDESPFLSTVVERFISHKSTARGREGWSEWVAARETYVLRKFVSVVGNQHITEITSKDLESFYYRDGVTSDHTRHGDYISINTFLNWCMKKELIKTKPEFKPDKPQSKLPKFIYPNEFAQLIQHQIDTIVHDINNGILKRKIDAPYWSVYAWMILAGTGMRPIELANLKVNQVHENHIIIGEDFKTKVKAERMVPLLFESKQAAQILTDTNFRKLEPNMADSPYLLGRSPHYAKTKLSRYFTKAWRERFPDKPKRTLYSLKDFFCVRFLSDDSTHSGMRLNDLREILGHASLSTTQRYLKAIRYGTSVTGTIWDSNW